METFDPQTLASLVLSGGLAVAMVWLAKRMNVLEQRQDAKCPACGVIRRQGSCGCTS